MSFEGFKSLLIKPFFFVYLQVQYRPKVSPESRPESWPKSQLHALAQQWLTSNLLRPHHPDRGAQRGNPRAAVFSTKVGPHALPGVIVKDAAWLLRVGQ
jgi:hypothetical protein